MRYIYIACGFLFFGLGAIGVVLPVLPTTPFLLLAAWFFARGSQRFHNWFISTKLYKKHLESFIQSRAMTLKSKICILALSSIMLLISFLVADSIPIKILLVFLIAYMYFYFFKKIRTIEDE